MIDTLVYNHFKDNDFYNNADYNNYLDILISVLEYLKKQNKEQQYWHAIGSNQQVKNTDKGKWISKAKEAYDQLVDAGSDECEQKKVLHSLFCQVVLRYFLKNLQSA